MSTDEELEISELIPDEKAIDVFVNKIPATKKEREKKLAVYTEDVSVPVVLSEDEELKKIEQDYKSAHENLQATLEIASNAVQDLEDLAKQSAHPRVYEVLNGFLKTIESTSKSLLELNKQKQELKKSVSEKESGDDGKQKSPNVTNNTLIVTTKELSEMVQNAIKKSN